MISIEACIHCDARDSMIQSVRAAHSGGAARIELCADMSVNGLTPSDEFISAARQYFTRPGLLVMIRPRAGNFCYDQIDLQKIRSQIEMAADCGADGIVLGILQQDYKIDLAALKLLIDLAKNQKLKVTFHRAFDATPNKIDALEKLIELGIDRVLTSGTKWGDGRSAIEGVQQIIEFIKRARDQIEIVIGGGVAPENAEEIVAALPTQFSRVSLHAYSGIRKNGLTDAELVGSLAKAAVSL